jgi:hypothetical protein
MRSGLGEAGGERFYLELDAAINRQIAPVYHTTITAIQAPSQGDFLWYYHNLNQVFNGGTFATISARVSPGDEPGLARLSPAGGFPNAYLEVLSCLAYRPSQADRWRLAEARRSARTLAEGVVASFQRSAGPITPSDLKTAQAEMGAAAVASPFDYVLSYALGYRWSGRQAQREPPLLHKQMAAARRLEDLLPQMPPSGQPVVDAARVYLSVTAKVASLQDEISLGDWTLTQLKNNTARPTEENGGMMTVDPSTGVIRPGLQVGYDIRMPLASIQAALEDVRHVLEVHIVVSSDPGEALHADLGSGAPLPVGSGVVLARGDGADLDLTRAPGAGRKSVVTIAYPGYVLVPMAPAAWQQATNVGWYYGDPIAQAYQNSFTHGSGYTFVSKPGYDLRPLAQGGDFGQLTHLLISNPPVVTVSHEGGDYARFERTWPEVATGGLRVFDRIHLGSSSGARYAGELRPGPSNEAFSVTLTPLPPLSTSQLLSAAYVIGGAVL